MFDRVALKQRVRDLLRGRWFPVFLGIFVIGLIVSGPSSILSMIVQMGQEPYNLAIPMNDTTMSGLSMAFSIYTIIVSPLAVALNGFAIRISRNGEETIGGIFSDAFQNWKTYFLTNLWVTLWSLIWMLPFVGLITAFAILVFMGNSLSFIFLFLSIVAIGLVIPRLMLYNMTFFIIADNSSLGAREALNESKRLMYGHRLEYFVFGLSFILWELLVVVTCGIASIYVVPYVNVSTAAYYDYLKGLASADTLTPLNV